MLISFNDIIDLSHTLDPDIPIWPGDPRISIETVATIERDGYALQRLTFGEQSGTHLGSSAHFDRNGIHADDLPLRSFVRTAVCIDVRAIAANDPDYALDREAVASWEAEYGHVPEGSVVLLNTGWSERWNDPDAYLGIDRSHPTAHRTPGFGLDAARFLADERGVVGLGIDTHGIDPGADPAFRVNAFWLRGERFHLENLTRLERLPATGITLFIGAPRIARSSGGPARVLALVE
jgi:kynurenine formamidase